MDPEMDLLSRIEEQRTGRDFLSTPNTLQTSKTLVIKKTFTADDKEVVFSRGQKVRLREITQPMSATYQMAADDFIVAINDVGVSRTVKFFKPSIAGIGKIYVIKDASGSATSTTIAISPFSTELIDGDTSDTINTNWGKRYYYTNGTNWFSI